MEKLAQAVTVRRCTECGVEKPRDFAHFPSAQRMKDGLGSACRDCHAKRERLARLRRKEANAVRQVYSPDRIKQCSKCLRQLATTEENYGVESTTVDGLNHECRSCHKQKAVESRQKRPLYDIWFAMNRRCANPLDRGWKRYGGRGIEVCEEWRDSYPAFRDWAMTHGWEAGLDIDRRNNDGPYSPDNCRFVTRRENRRNASNLALTPDIVRAAKRIRREEGATAKAIAWRLNAPPRAIAHALSGKTWTDIV